MAKIKYHFALNDKGETIDIANVTENDRQTKYYCLNCGDEMIPRLGAKNAHHFAHKTTTPDCNPETYLHKLAKLKIKEKFDSGLPFEISLRQTCGCIDKNNCPFYKEDECKSEEYRTYDLRKTYDTCTEEQTIGNYRADLLLTSSTKPETPPVLIEIFVTHKCEEEKVDSNNRIVEIPIKTEEDIITLLQSPITEIDKYSFDDGTVKCAFYNFSRSTSDNKLEARDIRKFYLFQSGAAYIPNLFMNVGNCRHILQKDNRKAILELAIDLPYEAQVSEYELGYAKAEEMGFDIKNCHLCKYLGSGFMGEPSVCCLYKKFGTTQYPKGPEAMTCSYYRQNHENDEALREALQTTPIIVCK